MAVREIPRRRAIAAGRPGAAPRAAWIEALLQEAFHGPAWHGPALRPAVQALDPARALRRRRDAHHSPWGLLLHAAYWKHRVRGRVLGDRQRFARGPANFPAPPPRPDPARWAEDLALLDAEHQALVDTLRELSERELDRRCGPHTVEAMIRGIAFHDVYHAGQIRVV